MRILVTGGAGFIGTNLCLKLLDQGHHVICVDISCPNITHQNYDGHVVDILGINKQIKVDQIYHLACHASPPTYQIDPIHTIRTCVEGTINVCEIAKFNNCPILFTSTSEIYGEPEISPQNESYRGNVNCTGPRACYDEGKRMAETILFEYHRLHGVDIKICRLFNTYGPFMNPEDGRVVSNFINQAIREESMTIYGDGEQTRSFCYIDDTINGILKLMKSKITGPVNIGNPHEISMKDLSIIITNLLEKEYNVCRKPLPIDDPTHRCPDISLANKILNWDPKIELEEGLRATIKYYESLRY